MPAGAWARRPARSSVGTASQADGALLLALWGEHQSTDADSESSDTKHTCAPPAASTAPGSPGARLNLVPRCHPISIPQKRGSGAPSRLPPPAHGCSGSAVRGSPGPAPAVQPSKAPRPTQDRSSRPPACPSRSHPIRDHGDKRLGLPENRHLGAQTFNGPNTSGKRPPFRKHAGGRTWRPGLALVPIPGFLTTSPRERRGAGRLLPAGL